MPSVSSVFAIMALSASASAACVKYSGNIYSLTNPSHPGTYLDAAITGSAGQTYCTLGLSTDAYLNSGSALFDFKCVEGWYATISRGCDYIQVTIPSPVGSPKQPVLASLEWETTDAGVKAGIVSSITGSIGC